MAESIADLDIPRRVIDRILKSELPEDVILTEEAKKAIGRSAAAYLLCVSSTAQFTYKTNQLNANMIIQTVVNLGFDQFRQPLHRFLEDYRKKHGPKPKNSRVKKTNIKIVKVEPKGHTDCFDNDVKPIVNQIEVKTD